MKRNSTLLILFIIITLSACGQQPKATISPATNTPETPASTLQPTNFPTADWQPISPPNATNIVEIARPNRGPINNAYWTPDGKLLLLTTSAGVSVHDGKTYQHIQDLDASFKATDSLLTPDGKTLIIATEDGLLDFWDMGSLQHVETQEMDPLHWCGTSWVDRRLSLYSTGRLMAIEVFTGMNCTLIWDLELGGALYAMDGHSRPVFSPTEPNRLVTYHNGIIYMRGAYDGEVLYYFPGNFPYRFSPDGTLLTAGYEDEDGAERTAFWEVQNGVLQFTFPGKGFLGQVHYANWQGSQLIVTSNSEGEIEYWNPSNGAEVYSQKVSDGDVFIHGVSQDLNWLILNAGGSILLMPTNTSEEIEPVKLSIYPNTWRPVLTLHPDNTRFFVAYGYAPALVWDIKSSTVIAELSSYQEPLMNISISPTGESILSHHLNNVTYLRQSFTGEIIHQLNFNPYRNTRVFYLPDGTQAFTISENVDDRNAATLTFWDTATGGFIHAVELEGDPNTHWIEEFALSPNGMWLASPGYGGIIIWQVSSGNIIVELKFEQTNAWAQSIAFSPDNHAVAALTYDDMVEFWESDTWTQTGILETPEHSNMISYSPDGVLYIITVYGSVYFWDESLSEWMQSCSVAEDDIINDISFDKEGHLLAIAHDNQVSLCDVHTHQIIFTTDAHGAWIPQVSFHPDDLFFLTISWDGTMRYWGIP